MKVTAQAVCCRKKNNRDHYTNNKVSLLSITTDDFNPFLHEFILWVTILGSKP